MARTRRHARKSIGSRKGKSVTRHNRRRGRRTRKAGNLQKAPGNFKDAATHLGHARHLVTAAARHGAEGMRNTFRGLKVV